MAEPPQAGFTASGNPPTRSGMRSRASAAPRLRNAPSGSATWAGQRTTESSGA